MNFLEQEVIYNNGHKCVPNGHNDFDFMCPDNGKQFFISALQREFIQGTCTCGRVIYPALYNGLNPDNTDYTKTAEQLKKYGEVKGLEHHGLGL